MAASSCCSGVDTSPSYHESNAGGHYCATWSTPRDLWSTAAEVARLAEATRAGRATRTELTGSTITISSLGALGGT
jgi:hypothetical protein